MSFIKTPITAAAAASAALKRVFFVFDFLSELSSIIHLVFSDTYCDLSLDNSNWSVETTESIVLSHSCFRSVYVESFKN